MSTAVRPSGDMVQVQPEEAWREVLLAPDAFDWLTHLAGTLRNLEQQQQQQKVSQSGTQLLASQARTLLVGA